MTIARKTAASALTVSLIIFTALSLFGCQSVSKKSCDRIASLQQSLSQLDSCRMAITSRLVNEKQDDCIISEFVYRYNDSGTMEYCHTQSDSNGKLVFCEASDSEITEQWLLGKGWGVISPHTYSKEIPHSLVGLLTAPLESDAIKAVSQSAEGTDTLYTVTLDAKKLQQARTEAQAELIEQQTSFLCDKDGNLLCYTDKAVLIDAATGQQSEYSLEIQLSEHGSVTEILKPELKASISTDATVDDTAAAEK